MIRPEDLLRPEKAGLYCPIGDFYIDPTRKVDRAVITHGHADHARSGHGAVLATPETLAIMAVRYAKNFTQRQDAMECGRATNINGVTIHFTPAGHILGSVQVTVEWKGLRITCTGDYKRKSDPTCAPFEISQSDVFITEATFALPVFNQPDPEAEIDKLFTSLSMIDDRPHFVGAYSLGKTQRIIKMARNKGFDAPITITPPAKELCELYQSYGVDLGPLRVLTPEDTEEDVGRLIVGPSTSMTDKTYNRLGSPVTCQASGWMQVRARARQTGVELPLIISDHADWTDLTRTIEEVDAQETWITHGREDALMRWATLNERKAKPLHLIGYEDEDS